MKTWNYLKAGDIIDVIAPSSYCSKEEARVGIRYLQSLGLQVRVPKGLVRPDFVYANNYKWTLQHLKYAFYAPDSKAVWCLRGGSGAFRFLPAMLNWKTPRKTKMFVGISDTTFLHLFLNQKWNWPTLHAPMISMLGARRASLAERRDLGKIIFGNVKETSFKALQPMNDHAYKKRTIHGHTAGGNLCIVESTVGTKYAPNFEGRILFLEDIDERGYAIERTLAHMKNAGVFDGARAVVFGDFVGGVERDGKSLVLPALRRFAQEMNFPVLRGIRSGHGALVRTFPLNVLCRLEISKKSQMVCQTGGSF